MSGLKLVLDKGRWSIRVTVMRANGERVRVRKATGFDRARRADASVYLSKILLETINGESAKVVGDNAAVTVDDGCRMYLTRPDPAGTTDVHVLGRFAKKFGDVALCDLSVADVMDWIARRGLAAGTVAREMNSFNAMLEHAKSMGVEGIVVRFKRPVVNDERTRWLSEAERDRLIECCGEEIKGLVTFLFFTGCTIGEAMTLRVADAQGGRAFFTRAKGRGRKKRTRAVPLCSAAAAVVPASGELCFVNKSGVQWDRTKFYSYWNDACVKAAITDFTPHDCRHTFASHLVQNGVSLRLVSDLLGHTSLAMVMRYSHLGPNHLIDAVGCLEGGQGKNVARIG